MLLIAYFVDWDQKKSSFENYGLLIEKVYFDFSSYLVFFLSGRLKLLLIIISDFWELVLQKALKTDGLNLQHFKATVQ